MELVNFVACYILCMFCVNVCVLCQILLLLFILLLLSSSSSSSSSLLYIYFRFGKRSYGDLARRPTDDMNFDPSGRCLSTIVMIAISFHFNLRPFYLSCDAISVTNRQDGDIILIIIIFLYKGPRADNYLYNY